MELWWLGDMLERHLGDFPHSMVGYVKREEVPAHFADEITERQEVGTSNTYEAALTQDGGTEEGN